MEQSGNSRTGRAFTGCVCDNCIGQFRVTTLFVNKGEKDIKYQSTVVWCKSPRIQGPPLQAPAPGGFVLLSHEHTALRMSALSCGNPEVEQVRKTHSIDPDLSYF